MRHVGRKGRAFTLVELLVVLALLALLAALIIPAAVHSAALGRQAICKGNLHRLAQGYSAYLARHRMRYDLFEGILTSTWAGMIMADIGDDPNLLICPEAPTAHYAEMPRFGQTDWKDMTWDFFDFSPPVWEECSVDSLFPPQEGEEESEDRQRYGGSIPSMWKMNEEDYRTWSQNRDGGWDTMENNREYMPKYTPGEDPDSYWILFEDAPGEWMPATDGDGRDYVDFDVHVTELSPGNYKFTFYDFGNSVARHWVIDANDKWLEVPATCEDGFGPFYWADAATNYGMPTYKDPNARVNEESEAIKASPGTSKILFLDYDDLVCQMGPPMPDPDEENSFENLIAPRHLGLVDVVYASGAVEAFRPDEINPRDETNYMRYWHPLDMPPTDN